MKKLANRKVHALFIMPSSTIRGLALLCCMMASVWIACVPKQQPATTPIVQTAPSETTLETQRAIQDIQTQFREGRMYAEIGYTSDARRLMDEATDMLFNQPDPVRQDPDFQTFSHDLLKQIHAMEMEWVAKGDTYTEADTGEQPNLIIGEQLTELSDTEASTERKLIEEQTVKSEIPIELNKQVLSFVKAYSERLKPVISASLARSGRYESMFRRIFNEEGVPEELIYLPIVESGYKTFALSHARAKGIWQFMSGTARLEGLTVDWWVDERCEPELSTRAAARHLKRLYDYFGDWYLALAAYNAGQGKISRAIRRAGSRDFWQIARHRWLLRRETKNYVPAFLAALIIAKDPERYGFGDIEYEEPLQYDTVTVDSCTDLRVIARLSDTTVRRIQEMNPHIRRLTTPVSNKPFLVRIPDGKQDQFETQFAQLPEKERVTLRYHRVRNGETLSHIARHYQTSVSAICKANGIRNSRLIRANSTLVIPIGQGHDYYYPQPSDNAVGKPAYPTGKKLVHRVHRGDTLFAIARRYRTDVKSVQEWNGLNGTLLKPGQNLTVYYNQSKSRNIQRPAQAATIPDGYHRVRRGDTLYSLSKQYGVSIGELRRWNNLRGSLIHPGDLIRIQNI